KEVGQLWEEDWQHADIRLVPGVKVAIELADFPCLIR
ncbi:unnamed protein product, partial [marine sediment metagenome]